MDLTEYVNSLPEAKPEQASTYLANKDKTVMTYNYDDGVDADYRYEVEQKKQARNAFFGKRAIEYKELTRNPLTSQFRGAYNFVVGSPVRTFQSGLALGEFAFSNANPGALTDEELKSATAGLNNKLNAWMEKYGAEKDEKDIGFFYNLGSVFGSLGTSWAFRSPLFASLLFGTGQHGSLYQEMRENGIGVDQAFKVASLGGVFEGGLEAFGLHMFLENFATKKISTFLFKQGLTEFTQEASQQFAEEMLMKYAGGRVDDVTGKAKTFLKILTESFYAGGYGALAGLFGGAVSTKSLKAFKGQAQKVLERGGMKKEEASRFIEERLYGNEKQQKELQDKVNDTIKEINTKSAALEFKKLGIEEEKAQELAESLATNPDDVKSELIDVLNKEADFETLQNNSLADDVAYFKEQRKKDMVAEAFDIKEKIKEDAIKSGVSEEEAEVAAALEANFALRMFEETGETPLEYYENKRALYETENESELTEEETARLEAQEQARKAEEDIPFFQESLKLAEENARLDEQYPAYEGETININGVQKTVYNSNGERIAKSAEALRNFYRWFGDSKVIDEQGRPLVVYHGTSAEFDTFMKEKRGELTEAKSAKEGFWFTDGKYTAETYAKYSAENIGIKKLEKQQRIAENQGNWDEYDRLTEEIEKQALEGDIREPIVMPVYLKAENVNTLDAKNQTFMNIQDKINNLLEKSNKKDGVIIYNLKDAVENIDKEAATHIMVREPNQIKSTSNRGTFSKDNPDIYYQFAGEKAKTAALDDLYYAQLMEQDGESKEKILRDTGWFKGADGKWRFEISDKNAIIKESGLQELNKGNSVKLEDILDHKDLYKAYPTLANIEVKIDESLAGTSTGAYVNGASAEDMTIYVRPGEAEDSFRKILLHEIQHDIQTIEGFARGGNESTVSNDFLEKRNEKIQSERDAFWENKAKELLGKEAKEYLDARKKAEVYGKKMGDVGEKLGKLKREHYWENNTKKREKLEERINKLEAKHEEYRKEWWKYSEMLAGKYFETEQKIYDALKKETAKNPQRYKILDKYMGGLEGYRRLYGEIEARNTEARSDLTGRERLERTPESTQDVANADAIVVFDDGTAMAYEPETFYQSAFAGSRVDYDRPSLEAIGSGEGNQAHGWGLYYALDRDVAEGYRERSYSQHKWAGVQSLDQEFGEIKVNGKPFLDVYDVDIDRTLLETLLYKPYGTVEELLDKRIEQWENLSKKDDYPYKKYANDKVKAYKDLRNDLYENGMNYIKQDTGQVHEVDIPENPYLLDEQKSFSEQSDFVKENLEKVFDNLTKEQRRKIIGDETTPVINMLKWKKGGEIYKSLSDALGSAKATSQMLEKYGIKGITYDGRQDGRCFVIFNPDDVKVIQKFYQGENNPLGSYMPASRVIHLFKKANRSTLIHELGHHFTMQYVKALEANGRTDKLEGFYNWLGINNISEATTETWEQMARGFETYVMEGESPNIDTESLFQKFKKYLIGVYTDLKGKVIKPEEINDDVREFFDIMIAGEEEAPDVRGLEGKLDQIKSAISGALKGEEVNFEGLSTKDLRELVKLMTMRKPRKPKNLKQKIRSVGGIDIDFAKAIGIYDSKKGNENGFFKKGGIDREDSLIDFLTEEGYIANTGAETYEETSAIMDQVIRLLENADNAYTAEEQQKMDERDAIEGVAYEAAKTLGNINTDDIFKAIKVLQKYDIKPVDKNTLKYLNASIKQVEKLAKEAKKEIRQAEKDIANKQADLIDYVKKLPLSYKSQMKIIERLKRATLAKDFEKVIDEAAELGKEFYREEKRKMLAGMINDEIKSSRPKKVTEQKYDYKNNKLFKDLRDYSKMTQDQAAEQLSKAEVSEDTTDEDLIRMRYLNYKSNGAKTSMELLEQIYTDLIIAKQNGLVAKDDADFERSMNREAVRQAIIDAIDANDADKNTLKTRIGNLYRKGLTNLYSLINSISSKKLADAFEMETVLNDAQVKYHKQTEALKEKTFKVYGVKTAGDLLNKFADMGKTIGHLYNVDGIKAEEISVMKLIDIYNAMRNEKTRQDYINNYGEEQLDRLLSNLTPQDIAFADLMMEDINSLFPEVNKTYIKIYGMDLLKVENYWPATSEHTTETSMLGDYYSQQTTPSSWKERTKGRVTPIPSNAWTKYLKHINENIYMINTAEKYKELATVFKSKRIRNKITNKFGASVYGELMRQISALSLNAKSDSLNYIESAFGSILNNFVVAKIAVAPTVFAGQLTSVTNYAENVKSSTFYKYFAEGLAHPKQTIKFMKEIAGDFLEARYKGGYAESISNVLREAEDAMSQKYRLISPKTKYNTANALSSFVRMGDIGAIIFGGYGQVKANLEAGMSFDEAVKRFEFDTLRSQQSSVKSSLGSFQQSKGIARMFLAFKNTQHQYFRKIADALINLQRGEISKAQAAKIIGNYALIQTTLYVMAKNLVNAGLGLLGDDDKITDGVLEQILLGTLDAIPFLSDALHFAYRRLTGTYSPNLVSMVGIDDIQRSINKFYKDEKSVYDYIEIITPLIEGTTSLPVQRFERMFKKWTGE